MSGMKWLFRMLRPESHIAPGGIPGLVLYDEVGRGLKLPAGAHVELRNGCLYVNSNSSEWFGRLDGWQTRITSSQLDRVAEVLAGCEWVAPPA